MGHLHVDTFPFRRNATQGMNTTKKGRKADAIKTNRM